MQEGRSAALGSTNEELIDEFGDALDEWAKEIKHLCRASGVQQQQLASRLTELSIRGNVDPSRVSKWLSGRKIVVTGGAALPGRGLSQDIVRALGLQGAQARRVLQLGERIDLVQVQLERRYPTGWRAAAQAHFRSSAKTARTSSSSADDTAGSSAGEASLPSVSQCQDASEVPLVGTTVTMVAADDEKTKAQPPLAAGDEPSDLPRHVRGQRLWRGQPKWIKALATVTAVAVTVAAVITAVVGSDGDERTGDGAEGSSPQASASMGSSVQERPEAVPSESLGLASILRDGPPTESVDRFRSEG